MLLFSNLLLDLKSVIEMQFSRIPKSGNSANLLPTLSIWLYRTFSKHWCKKLVSQKFARTFVFPLPFCRPGLLSPAQRTQFIMDEILSEKLKPERLFIARLLRRDSPLCRGMERKADFDCLYLANDSPIWRKSLARNEKKVLPPSTKAVNLKVLCVEFRFCDAAFKDPLLIYAN